jgi:hypothetical protein
MKDLKIQMQTPKTNMKTIKKIAIAMVLFCVASCINRAEPEMHLLPKGFQGYVIIVFNDPNGQDEKYEDDFRVYEIPSNGVLRTKFSRQDGWIANGKLKFYYSDSNSRQEIIEVINDKNVSDSTTIHVMNEEFSKSTVRYIVSSINKRDTYLEEMHKKIDELFPPVVQ